MSAWHRKTMRGRFLRPALALVLAVLSPGQGTAQSSSEMVAGANYIGNLPATLGPVTVTLLNNSDNPGGTTFATIATPAPTATLQIALNSQYSTPSNFTTHGTYVGTAAGTRPGFELMNTTGSATNALFTSLPFLTPGTGIAVGTNRGAYIESQTRGLQAVNAARTGRLRVADITIDFNVPISNVVLHLGGLGVSSGGKRYTTEFDLDTQSSEGATGLTRLSGNSAFAVSGLSITNSASAFDVSCVASPGAACGSAQVMGTAITRIVLKTYLRSSDAAAWPTDSNDGFILGLSGEVADLVPALGTIPATVQPGETYRGLTATCTNTGPNTARDPTCALTASTGTVANLTCTGITGNALAPGVATCTYDYTAPLSGSGVSNTVFTSTTGAPNDRNGGTTTGGNNIVTASRTLSDSPFAPGAPAGICSAIADRLSFSFTGVAGGTEAGSYDLISHSPFSYNVGGKPVFMTGSGTVSTQTVATTPGALFQPAELTTATLPTTATTGTGEIVIITSRIVGRAGSAMTVRVSDTGQDDHDLFTIETTAGAMLARSPASGSNATNGDLVLSFTMPSGGVAYLRQYIADYGSAYGQRLDGGCLRTDLVTVKTRSAPATGSIEVGESVTFTITVTNNGPSDTSNLQLTDVMPATLSGGGITTVASVGAFNPSTGLWTVPALASGAPPVTLTLTGKATAAASDTSVTNNTTAAVGDQTDTTTVGDVLSASVLVVQAAQVTALKSVTLLSNSADNCGTRPATPDAGVEAFIPGSCIEYVIRLTNPTTAVARNILMTDVLGAGFTFMSTTAAGFDITDPPYLLTAPASGSVCTGSACTVRLDKARLPAGASGQVRIRAILR